MWRKGKRDKNEAEIIAYLISNGVNCQSLTNQVLDLIIWDRTGGTSILEIKNEKTTYQRTQIKFIANWEGPIGIVKTKTDALTFAIHPDLFTINIYQKKALKQLLLEDVRESFPSRFIEIILEQNKGEK